MAFTKVAPAGIGSTPGDGYRIGDSFLHSTGVEITNINATGIVTAASLDISGAIDFDGHTNLDNVSIAGVTTASDNIRIIDSKKLLFGDANGDMSMYHIGGANSYIVNKSNNLYIQSNNAVEIGSVDTNGSNVETSARFVRNGASELFWNDVKKFETTNTGAVVSGILTATSFSGALPISNDGNDRVLTSSGSGVVNAEANLQMTGNILTFNTTANTHRIQNVATGDHYCILEFDSNRSSANASLAFIDFQWDGDKVADIQVLSGSDTTNKDDGHLVFRTSPQQGGISERLRIKSNGQIVLGSDGTNSELTFTQDGTSGTQLNATTTGSGGYNTLSINSATFIHKYGTNERLRINSDGKVGIATGTGSGLINTRHGGTNQQVLHVRADLGSSNGRSLNLYTPDTDNTNAPFRFQTGNGFLFQCDSENVFTVSHDRRIGINQLNPTEELEVSPSGTSTSSTIFIHAPTHNTNVASETVLKFGYGHSGSPDGIGYIKMIEDANNSFDADFVFGLPSNNGSGGSTTNNLVTIRSEGHIDLNGTNHATRYFRDDGARYGQILYDGSNFVSRMPAGDNFQVELFDGTTHTRFNNVNGASGSGSMIDFYGGDNTYLYVRGGTETKPSIYMGGGAGGVDNSRIGTKYNLALACNEDGNQTGRKIVFYDDDVKLAELREDNQGTSSAQGCLYTTGPGAIRDYYDMRNIRLDGVTFDYVSNDSDGGGTTWEIKNGSVIRLYSTSGGHGGKWGREVYIRQNGYYYWRCNIRLTTTCGYIHSSTSTNNYKYPIMFRFRMHNSGAGNNCQVELNQHYATSGTCNGSQTGTGTLTDGTYVTRTGDAVYLTAGVYQPRYFTSGYAGVRELHIYELALIQCGSSTSGA